MFPSPLPYMGSIGVCGYGVSAVWSKIGHRFGSLSLIKGMVFELKLALNWVCFLEEVTFPSSSAMRTSTKSLHNTFNVGLNWQRKINIRQV